VLKVEPGFEAALARGERPALAIVSDSSNAPAQAGAQRLAALLEGFNRERGALTLALRGVPPAAASRSTCRSRTWPARAAARRASPRCCPSSC
jgi:hypothetical protein